MIAGGAAVVLAVAGIAVGLTAAFDGGSSNPSKTVTTSQTSPNGFAQTPTQPQIQSQTGTSTQPQTLIPPQSGTPTQPTQPQLGTPTQTGAATSTIPNLPSIEWLGMQIITGPSGPEVTLVGTGAGNAYGFQPEDVISTFDNQEVSTAVQISKIAASLPLGSQIPITVIRGGSTITMAVTMKERPTVQP